MQEEKKIIVITKDRKENKTLNEQQITFTRFSSAIKQMETHCIFVKRKKKKENINSKMSRHETDRDGEASRTFALFRRVRVCVWKTILL